MSGLTAVQVFDVAVHFTLALVWATVAASGWRLQRKRRPQSRFFRMVPVVGTAVALAYADFTLIALTPLGLRQSRPLGVVFLAVLNDCIIFIIVALARHMARYFETPEAPTPGPRWLAVNYGSSAIMCGLAMVFTDVTRVPLLAPYVWTYAVLRVVYQIVMLGLIVVQIVRIARPGVWEAGGGGWVARRADAVFLGGALVSLAAWLVIACSGRRAPVSPIYESSIWFTLLDAISGVGFAVPLAVRILGELVRTLLMIVVTLVATAAAYYGAHQLAAFASPELRGLLDVGTIAAIVLVLVPGQSWLRGAIDQVVFRRSRRRREELQAFLHTLSPELSSAECCRRALAALARVMQLRGAAALLRTGETVVEGAIAFAPLERLWRSTAAGDTFPSYALVGYELRELPPPLRDELINTDVVGVVPMCSPRSQHGVLLISTGLLGAAFSEDETQVLQAFVDQLALVLDGSELLARTVAVERSLAHSERLAAIGELAARIAHEIRNPVTAARSLAQQLSREPASPLNAEHADLILRELERVERQVAALLRFARREEFRFEPVDVGELVQETMDSLRPRCEAAGIEVALRLGARATATADREKLRQVVINLVENAMDALANGSSTKRITLAVGTSNGSVNLSVSDTGPGVAPDTLPRLFEPFFSLKEHGTGLGLAIARRTIDAHGGRIVAASTVGAGTTLVIELPETTEPRSTDHPPLTTDH